MRDYPILKVQGEAPIAFLPDRSKTIHIQHDSVGDAHTITARLAVCIQEELNKLAVEAIRESAIKHGFTDVMILDKDFIHSALQEKYERVTFGKQKPLMPGEINMGKRVYLMNMYSGADILLCGRSCKVIDKVPDGMGLEKIILQEEGTGEPVEISPQQIFEGRVSVYAMEE